MEKVIEVSYGDTIIDLSDVFILSTRMVDLIYESYEKHNPIFISKQNKLIAINPSVIPFLKLTLAPLSESDLEYLNSIAEQEEPELEEE